MRLVSRLLCFFLLLASAHVSGQSCISTGLNGTIVNLPCNVNCAPMKFKVPHLKSTSDYKIVPIPYDPLPFTTPGGTELTTLYGDDVFGDVIPLPFPFCFYDSLYNAAVVGSNGIITFDVSMANTPNAYPITETIPYAGGSSGTGSPAYYPKASIMGAYSDLDPRDFASPSDRKIEWRFEGTAPCRKLVVSYYHVGVFGNNTCGIANPTTFQMILYEATGVIDVVFEQKACFPSTNGGNAILGVQNWQRNKAVAGAGMNATHWEVQDTAYRFVPSGPVSRFVKAEMWDLSGNIIATTGVTPGADTATTVPGMLDLNFPQVCPTAASTQYIVKAYFASCADPTSMLISSDTITVNKTTSLNATASQAPAACGSNGSITVNIPTGAGSPPYSLSLDGGAAVTEPGQTHTFSGIASGPHTVTVTTSGGCSQTINITVGLSNNLTIGQVVTPTSCQGAANGSITMNPLNGTSPFQYSISGSGGPWQNSNTYSNLPPGGYFISVKDNSGCAVYDIPITVGMGAQLTTTVSVVPPACAGASNGQITVNPPAGGTQPIQYSIDGQPLQLNNVFTGLATGSHFVKFTDALGCTNTMLINVPAGTGTLNATATSNSTSCAGASNGSINITPANGSAPYQYSLDGGTTWQAGLSILNLAPGSYSVKIKDNGGCTSAPISVTVATGNALLANVTATATSCTGVNNGTINVVPTTGSGPYTYSLDGGTAQSSGTFTNVSAGNHTIIVNETPTGCVSNAIPVTVAVGPALTGTATATTTSCNGAADGTITITPGTTGTFTFQLDGGSPQSGNIFNNVASGSHNVVISDPAGCSSAPIPVTIAAGPALTGNVTSTATSCTGVSNGSINVVPTLGTAPFLYSLDGGPFQNSASFTGVAAGNHTVIFKDNSGCTSTSLPVSVAVGPALTGTATATATTCNGSSDGSIQAVPGTNTGAPYTYQLDGGSFQASGSFTNVSAGPHTIVIKDNAGCSTAPINVTVAPGPGLTATVATTPTSCSGAINGTITVTPATTGTYEYSIDGVNFQSSNSFTGLTTGNYTITYRNNLGCTATVAATVNPGQPLSAVVTPVNVSCNGGNDGTASIAISTNAAPPYQYSLDGVNWQPAANFTGLAAGSYTAYFKDNNNCSGTQSFAITQPAPLTITPSQQAALCNGQPNGQIIIAANGGTSPYSYSIDGTTYQSSNSFSVASGSYTVYVKDNRNCIKTQTVNIGEPQVLSVTSVTTNSSCLANDGTLTASGNGGSGNYLYSIDGTNFQSSTNFTLAPGNYLVTVKDANGCTASYPDTVRLTNNLVLTPANDTTICEGQSVKLKPATNATQFSWTPSAGLSSPTVGQPTATPSATTVYTLSATLGVCNASVSSTVNVWPAPIADAGPAGDICYGRNYQLQGSGGIDFEWSPTNDMISGINSGSPIVAPAQTTQYSLFVVDANGCRSLQPDVVTVNVTPPIVVTITHDTAVANGDVIQLNASSVATDYSWSPAFGLNDPSIPNPLATVTGDITYTVEATTSAGCKGEASVTLKVYEGPEIYVPTAFSPNGDGKNDRFTPYPVGIKEYTYFRVFNRWGQLIFSTTSFNQGWDGKLLGKDQPTGTYVWMVEGITKDNKKISKRGTVLLIR